MTEKLYSFIRGAKTDDKVRFANVVVICNAVRLDEGLTVKVFEIQYNEKFLKFTAEIVRGEYDNYISTRETIDTLLLLD